MCILTKAHNLLNLVCAYHNELTLYFMNTKRTHIIITEELAGEIDRLVGSRQRSSFLSQAAWREVKRRQMLDALEETSGAWKDADHPELKTGSAKYVERLRKEEEQRFKRVMGKARR